MAPVSPLFLRDEELERALHLLWLSELELMNIGLRVLEPRGLSAKDYLLLFLVGRRPGTTMAELTRPLATSKQALSRHVIKLRELGLLEERSSGLDRRTKPLQLTPAGRELLDAALAQQKRRLKRAFRTAGADAVSGFLRLLECILEERGQMLAAAGGSV